ncbi:MAG: hypothetical protein AAF512_24165 [Pseudomonadota bacterium]
MAASKNVLKALRDAGLAVSSHHIVADSRTRRLRDLTRKQQPNRDGWVITHSKPQGWLINYGTRTGRIGTIKTWLVAAEAPELQRRAS